MKQVMTDHGLITFDPRVDVTLLDAMERQGLPARSSCRDGYCHECRITLEAGSVLYVRDALIDGLEQQQKILPCSCKPKTSIRISLQKV